MIGIESYGVALPTLRLPASAYVEAWGSCAARGLKQKAFCAYDEDPVTLGIGAAREALRRLKTPRPLKRSHLLQLCQQRYLKIQR